MVETTSIGPTATPVPVSRSDRLRGIIPYLVTPVDQDGGRLTLRTEVLSELCQHLIASGVHGLAPLGSTGEFAYLTPDLRLEVVQSVVRNANGQVPVVPCVGGFSTAGAIDEAKSFVECGADALVAILQEYFPLSIRQTVEYFSQIADAVDVPICIYTNPGVLGSALPLEAIRELSTHPRIQYIKDASTNTGRILSIIRACGDQIDVFSASAHVPALVLALGGVGWMAGPAAVAPRVCLRLYELAIAGDWTEALDLQRGLWELNEAFAAYTPPASMKAALSLQGFDVGAPIAPQSGLGPEAVARLRETVSRVRDLIPPSERQGPSDRSS